MPVIFWPDLYWTLKSKMFGPDPRWTQLYSTRTGPDWNISSFTWNYPVLDYIKLVNTTWNEAIYMYILQNVNQYPILGVLTQFGNARYGFQRFPVYPRNFQEKKKWYHGKKYHDVKSLSPSWDENIIKMVSQSWTAFGSVQGNLMFLVAPPVFIIKWH